jgi:hypothetical protein
VVLRQRRGFYAAAYLSAGIAAITFSLALTVWSLGLYLIPFVAGFCYKFEYHKQGGNDGRAL